MKMEKKETLSDLEFKNDSFLISWQIFVFVEIEIKIFSCLILGKWLCVAYEFRGKCAHKQWDKQFGKCSEI